MSGYVISKPPQSPALFWHQDWWGWNDPSSYTPLPQQLFFMYYLVDTTPHNGCLRLLRGSHLQRHRMHDEVPDAHTDELRRFSDPDHPAYQSLAEEVDVPVKAGDLVIGDSRLLHSAHANKSDHRRTVITLWYFPYFELLSDGLRAAIARPREWTGWDDAARTRVADLVPIYSGGAAPVAWNREPGELLQ
jgi:ectoine hydroxylase-related dioxygenase (phytanoyl-CoA dioxygenase family)